MEKVSAPESDYQYNDNERLKTLYSISKKLSVFRNVEESFSDIVTCAASSFPLMSAVLIEHWEKIPRTAVWFSDEASKETVANALLNAKTCYSFLSGASFDESKDLLKSISSQTLLSQNPHSHHPDGKLIDNYIVIPLAIDNLPPLGALQFEGASILDEKDLEFVHAFANLVSVALDRFYKTKQERAFARAEIKTNLEEISSSKNRVNDLELESALREDFVSLLTHDLKSPLSVIMGTAELICRRKDSPDTCFKLGGMIVNKSKQVVKMINNLLDANQIRSGKKLVLTIGIVNLNSLVLETLSELKIVHGNRFELVASHQIEQSCDAHGVKRILENLCNNAIKYGSPSSPVKVILEEDKSEVLLKVHNFGKVISPEDQKNIFQQFHRTTEALLGPREGWGIGLTLVRGVAEAHGGSVQVESSAESGTCFIVRLPKDFAFLN